MSITINTKAYAFDSQRTVDSFRYNGPDDTKGVKDYVDAKRVEAKPTKDYAGQAKGSLKLTRTLTDGTVAIGVGLLEISISVPVDAATAECNAMIDDLASWLATANAKTILIDGQVSHI